MKNNRSIRWVEINGTRSMMQITHLDDGSMVATCLVIETDQNKYLKQRGAMRRAFHKDALRIVAEKLDGSYVV